VGDGAGAVTAMEVSCGSCDTDLSPDPRFCNKCGVPVTPAAGLLSGHQWGPPLGHQWDFFMATDTEARPIESANCEVLRYIRVGSASRFAALIRKQILANRDAHFGTKVGRYQWDLLTLEIRTAAGSFEG
jgi:predicted amidophosphoribosyltransferase